MRKETTKLLKRVARESGQLNPKYLKQRWNALPWNQRVKAKEQFEHCMAFEEKPVGKLAIGIIQGTLLDMEMAKHRQEEQQKGIMDTMRRHLKEAKEKTPWLGMFRRKRQ